RKLCTHTSKYHARDRWRRSGGGFADAIRYWGEAGRSAPPGARRPSEGGRSPPPSLIANAGVQEGIREVDEEVQAHDHGRDDEVHRLHDGIVELAERLEEEQADAGQPKNCFDDDGAADVERHLQADEAD